MCMVTLDTLWFDDVSDVIQIHLIEFSCSNFEQEYIHFSEAQKFIVNTVNVVFDRGTLFMKSFFWITQIFT